MDARSLVAAGMKAAGSQLTLAIKGLTDAQLDLRPNASAMTLREQIVHLTECYLAMQAAVAGTEHEWGSYTTSHTSLDELLAEMLGQRNVATDAALASPDEQALTHAIDYMILHDGYHVGQLCTLHAALDPEWMSYSIYGE